MNKPRKWLAQIRGERTHQEVADLVGIGRAFYTQIENGARTPSVFTAKKIAKALGFDWTFFFNDNCSDMPPTSTGKPQADSSVNLCTTNCFGR
ncbi:MAG: helix-turn-helix transcriptional regulator [Bacillota bacterium]